jgi:hypothetical protein
MKNRFSYTLLIVLCLVSLTLLPAGCGLLHPGSQRKIEKKQAQESKKADKEYDLAKKQHLKHQNKKTLKMMKKTKKRSDAINKPKKRGMFTSKKCN